MKGLEDAVQSVDKLESELLIKCNNVRSVKVDVTEPAALNKLKGDYSCVRCTCTQCMAQ